MVGIKEGTCWDEHSVWYVSDKSLNSTLKEEEEEEEEVMGRKTVSLPSGIHNGIIRL